MMGIFTGRFELVPAVREHETPESFVSRLAAYNCLESVDDLFRLIGEVLERPDVSRRFARIVSMAGVSGARFYGMTAGGTSYHVLEGHSLKREQTCRKFPRYCPVCVSEDIIGGIGPVGARTWQRFWWQCTAIETCETHGCKLLTGQQKVRANIQDFAQYVAANTRLIESEAASARRGRARAFDSYLLNRLLGKESISMTFLDDIPLYAATQFCAALGAVLDGVLSVPSSSLSEGELRANGFDLVAQGHQKMFAVLHERAIKNNKGLNKLAKYGSVYLLLRPHRANPEWRSVVELFRRDGFATLPLDKGDEFLGELLTARRVHSVYSIGVKYKIHPTTVVRILEHVKMLPDGLVRDRFGMHVVSAEPAEAVLDHVKYSVTTPVARSRLGLNLVLLQRFREAGFLSLIDVGSVYLTRQPRYALSGIQRLLGEIESLEVVQNVSSDYRSFVTVSKWGRIVTTAAWGLVREGSVRAIRKEAGRGFLGVYIHHGDLLAARPQIDHNGMTEREVARALQTGEQTVKRLLESGVLGGRMMFCGWEGRQAFYVDRGCVEEFPHHYASIVTLAKESGISVKILLPDLDRSGFTPVFKPLRPAPPEGKEARIYRRSEVNDFISSLRSAAGKTR